jgi:methyl-accepting chemotaxis protein
MVFFKAKKGFIHLIWVIPVSIISIYLCGRYYFSLVSNPLKMLTKSIDQLADGNLSIKIEDNLLMKKNELGEIANSLSNMIRNLKLSVDIANLVSKGYVGFKVEDIKGNGDLDNALKNMVKRLHEVINNLGQAAENVASGSKQISSSAQSLAQGANEQAASVEEASASLEQMAASIGQNSDNAKHSNNITRQIKEKIEVILVAVNQTYLAMNAIVEKISLVNNIANKTDLLSINAAIEAAKAGEYGKGFAVVANEVRKLAENSKYSALEIENVSKESLIKAEKSNTLLNELAPEIIKASDLIQEIAAASIEQSSGINQVNLALQQLNQVTQHNSSLSEELSSNSEELSSQAENLYTSLSFFKLSKDVMNQYTAAEIENQIKKFQDMLLSFKNTQSIFDKEFKSEENKMNLEKEEKVEKNTGQKINLSADGTTDQNFEKY